MRPIRRAGTEYLFIRTVISADLSTRGWSTRPGSKTSPGRGASSGCSLAQSCPTVVTQVPMRRVLSFSSQRAIISLSSARVPTFGTGVSQVRRNLPTSPSTPPFS